jgi:hypothetical protein
MSDDDLIDWGLAFYIIRFVQSITEPIEIMTYGSRPEGKWSRRSLGGLQGVNGLLTIAAFSCKTRILLATYPLPSGGSFNDLIVLNPDMQDDWELNALYWNQVYYLTDIIANILYLPPKLGVAFVAWRNDWDLDKRDKYKKGVNSLKVLTGIARFIMNIIWAVEESEMVKTAKRDWNGRSDADLLSRGMDKHENFGFYSEPNITDDDIIDAERTRYQQLYDTGESDLLSLASARATGALPAIATFGKLTKNPKARLVSSLLTFVGFYANGSLMLVYANSYQAAHQG